MTTTQKARHRRGALLLLVLGVLMLFLLMGTMMLTLATRTRTTARAFAAATTGQSARPLLARRQLDQALLTLLRGGPGSQEAGLSESILADMYGTTPALEGRVTSLVIRGPLVEATVENIGSGQAGPVRASDLGGRVITFRPNPDSGDSVASLRIVRATGTGTFTCWLSRSRLDSSLPLPRTPCAVVINQPAFRTEAYDAYDAQNPWLTRVALEDGRVASVPRPAFAPSGASTEVDNDNDGIKDGVWLRGIFDSQPAAGGGKLEFDVSYLVLDLDGRVNVNAHGSPTSLVFPADQGYWTKAPDVPTGSGYGPADIDASLVFVDPLKNGQVQTDPPLASDRWRRIVGVTTLGGLTATTPSANQRRPVALVGPVEGRYGTSPVAGAVGNDILSQRNELLYGDNPLVDLKSMVKVQMETGKNSGSAVPKMVYYCPDWTKSGYADDPYELRLDGDAPMPFELRSTASQVDNPYTPADLEAVLRQFDTDATTLSPRLAIALDDSSQRSRMLVTTDSWDTPGLTGTVAGEIAAYVAGLPVDPAGMMSPDVLAGLRFDLNRAFPTGAGEAAAKQDFCKHLYMLLVALGRPAAAETAQWAANVVDYRDPDSRFTRFQFDTDPSDGWGAGTAGWQATNVVWGAERPELVIAQTLGWRTDNDLTAGELYVSLHRPWYAEMVQQNGTVVPADVLDSALASRADLNTLDLAKKNGNDPIWRLRFDEDSKFVRFDPPQQNDSHPAFPAGSVTFTSTDRAELPPNSYLVVQPKGVSKEGIKVDNALQQFNITKGGTFRAQHW